MKLAVFDMDQTLVDVTEIHDAVTEEVFRQRFGVEARLTEIDFAGRSLQDNLIELARLKGIPAEKVSREVVSILQEYDAVFQKTLPANAGGHVLPGVIDLLERLTDARHFVVLYTGDSPGVTHDVLNKTGLDRFFRLQVFGTEAVSREDLLRQAIARAEQLSGRIFQSRDVVVIGDSIRDIQAGKSVGAHTIAVATGIHSREELLRYDPDLVVNDLRDVRVFDAMAGPVPAAK